MLIFQPALSEQSIDKVVKLETPKSITPKPVTPKPIVDEIVYLVKNLNTNLIIK